MKRRGMVSVMLAGLMVFAASLAMGGSAHAAGVPTDVVQPLNIGAAFTLINRGTNKCAEVAGGSLLDNAPVVENDCLANNTDPNQNWLPVSVGGGFFNLRNVHSNLCLDFARPVNTQTVKHHVCGGDLSERWQLVVSPNVPGFLTVVSANHSGGHTFCLDLRDGQATNGTTVQIYDCLGAVNNQLWRQG